MTRKNTKSLNATGDRDARRVPVIPLIVVLLVALTLSMFLATGFGPSSLPPSEALEVVKYKLGIGDPVESTAETIVWNIRIPRIILGACVGAGLAMAGAIIQTLVRNPLADPYLLGISSGASVGATAFIVFGTLAWLGQVGLTLGALLGALVAAALVFGVAMAQGGLTPLRLVLTGTVLSSAFSSLASFLVFQSEEPQAAQSVLYWLLGSLTRAKWSNLAIPIVTVILCLVILMTVTSWMDAMASGAELASSLGVPVVALRNMLFLIQAVLVGVMVAVAGGIGFVGLIVPHVARLLVGSQHRRVVPTACLLGALFLVWVDVAARTLAPPKEMPLGIVTGLIGAPLFLILLGRHRYEFGGVH